MSMPRAKFKVVWGAVERGGKTSWVRIGHAWEAADGAIYGHLSAFPLSGRFAIRDGFDEVVEAVAVVEEAM